MLTILLEKDGAVHQSADAALLGELLADSSKPFWVDLESPTPEEFVLLSHPFAFHPLAIEDAGKPHQRPKVDEFDGFIFLVADEVAVDLPGADRKPRDSSDDQDDVQTRQLSLFLGPHFLVTIHTTPVDTLRELRDQCSQKHQTLSKGADHLLYALLDRIVDGYFPVLDTFDDALDDLEDRVVGRPDSSVLETIFNMKRDVTRFRKLVGPLREVLQSLTTRDFPNIRPETLPYFRDVSDHLYRIYETLDGYRDLMSNMLDAYLSQVSNQMNLVMQRLAVVGTVFLPLTFVTGVFGMNFAYQPWLKTNAWGWMGGMALIGLGMFAWFHRRRLV